MKKKPEAKKEYRDLIDKLAREMSRKGITQSSVAKQLGCSAANVNQIMNMHEGRVASFITIIRIASLVEMKLSIKSEFTSNEAGGRLT